MNEKKPSSKSNLQSIRSRRLPKTNELLSGETSVNDGFIFREPCETEQSLREKASRKF